MEQIKRSASLAAPTKFSGTIIFYTYPAQALPSYDVGRAIGVLQRLASVAELAAKLGSITINVSEWYTSDFSNLKWCDKDAEIMVA